MKKILNTLGELIYLNILFLLTSLPIITIGTAIVTSYEIIELITRGFEINILTIYFKKFKNNFLKTLTINIIAIVLLGFFLLICKFLYIQNGIFGKIILYPFISSGLLIYIIFLYYYYLVREFKDKTNIEIIKYSLYLGIKNIFVSLIIVIVHLSILGGIFFFSRYLFFIWEFFIIIGFSIIICISYKLFQKIKY